MEIPWLSTISNLILLNNFWAHFVRPHLTEDNDSFHDSEYRFVLRHAPLAFSREVRLGEK